MRPSEKIDNLIANLIDWRGPMLKRIREIFHEADSDVKETSFKVTKSKVYGATDKPTEVFTSKSGAHLNLITCTGSWDKNKSEYDKRLVVFTDLVK